MTAILAISLVVKVTLLLALAWSVDRMLGAKRVLAASAWWNAILVALVALPIVALAVPQLEIPVIAPEVLAERLSPPISDPAERRDASSRTDPLPSRERQLSTATAVVAEAESINSGADSETSIRHARFTPFGVIAAIYLVGVLAMFMRLAADALAVIRLRRSGSPNVGEAWHTAFESWTRRLGFDTAGKSGNTTRSPVALIASDRTNVPLALGVLRRTIVLPSRMIPIDHQPSIDAVLVHELVHLARRDTAWQLLERLIAAVLWFHPLFWLARRRMAYLRERACDDFSIGALGDRHAYAETLLTVAAELLASRPLVLSQAVVRSSNLWRRLVDIDKSEGNRRCVVTRRTLSAIAVAAGLLVLLSATFSPGPANTSEKPTEPARTPSDDGERGTQEQPEEKKPADIREHLITVTGRALDGDGKPIAGATIFLASLNYVSSNNAPDQILGMTATDREGRYAFHDAKLPIRVAQSSDKFVSGSFEVFGKASGMAFAWSGLNFYQTTKRPSFLRNGELINRGIGDRPRTFAPGEKIEIDLTFQKPKPITGRFVDEKGKPIAGIELELNGCNPASRLDDIDFWAIDQAAAAMPDHFRATTDVSGRFEFPFVPVEAVCWVGVKHPHYGEMSFYTSTMKTPPAEHDDGHRVVPLPIEMTLKEARAVTLHVHMRDTLKPVAQARVFAYAQRASGFHSGGVSDEKGTVHLKLPPGKYKVCSDAPRETAVNWVRTYMDLTIDETAQSQAAQDFPMTPACTLLLRAVDATTRTPIPGVTFWHEPENQIGGSWQVQSNPSIVDNPKTDARGELRALVLPGKRRYSVTVPAGYKVEGEAGSQEVNLPGGETVTVEFQLRKK